MQMHRGKKKNKNELKQNTKKEWQMNGEKKCVFCVICYRIALPLTLCNVWTICIVLIIHSSHLPSLISYISANSIEFDMLSLLSVNSAYQDLLHYYQINSIRRYNFFYSFPHQIEFYFLSFLRREKILQKKKKSNKKKKQKKSKLCNSSYSIQLAI